MLYWLATKPIKESGSAMKRALMTVSAFFLLLCSTEFVRTQEPQDRCENNRRQISEYLAELRDLEIIPTASVLERERKNLSILNKLIAENKILDDYLSVEARKSEARLYNMPWRALWEYSTPLFLRALRDRLNILITKAAADGFPAIQTRIKFVNQQISIHDNRLLDLKCGTAEEAGVCKIAGKWRQSVGSTWTVTADGTATEQGLGGATGKASLSGTTMRIEWSHANGWSGTYEWVMDKTCKTGKGKLIFKSGGSGEQVSNVTYTPL